MNEGDGSNGISSSEKSSAENDDEWCEVEERPCGVTDTLLEEPGTAYSVDKTINVAPAEGNRPLGLFIDKDSEHLLFPTIFLWKT